MGPEEEGESVARRGGSPIGANPADPWGKQEKGGKISPPFFPIGLDLPVPSVVAVIFHPGFFVGRRRQRTGFYRPLQDKPYRERILRSPEFVRNSSAGRHRQYPPCFHDIKI